MRPLRIAIPAGKNSFHHEAALNYFGTYHEIIHCAGMNAAALELIQNTADYAILASENSIAGKIVETEMLLKQNDFSVVDRIVLPVSLCLAGIQQTGLKKIREVVSNKYAFLQSEELLAEYGISVKREVNDTAIAAMEIASGKNETKACICSGKTAAINGLKILLQDIQRREDNCTHFLILSKSGRMKNAAAHKISKPIYISL